MTLRDARATTSDHASAMTTRGQWRRGGIDGDAWPNGQWLAARPEGSGAVYLSFISASSQLLLSFISVLPRPYLGLGFLGSRFYPALTHRQLTANSSPLTHRRCLTATSQLPPPDQHDAVHETQNNALRPYGVRDCLCARSCSAGSPQGIIRAHRARRPALCQSPGRVFFWPGFPYDRTQIKPHAPRFRRFKPDPKWNFPSGGEPYLGNVWYANTDQQPDFPPRLCVI